MANKLVWGRDLYNGFKIPQNNFLKSNIDDMTPFQFLTLEEKTIDWIKAVADFYEAAGWRNVELKASKIQKNFWMRYGKLNMADYLVDAGDFADLAGIARPHESQSPLEQFYPLAPIFVDVLRGEFVKRDNRWTVEAIDPYSATEAFEFKRSQFDQIVSQFSLLQKQQTLAQMGLTEESDPQQYMQQMQAAMTHLQEVELKSKSFRTTGVKWAEKVLKIHEKRYDLAEIEPDGFESGLITDGEFWHIDLLDDDFKVELLNSMYCDFHKGPNVKYVSEGDYFLWFDFMSTGDIVNKYARRMKEEDLLKLKQVYLKTANLLIPDQLKVQQDAYYDYSKPWSEATDLNPVLNDVLLGKELAYNYMRSPNFDHNIDTDIFNPMGGRLSNGKPQMFRVMRLYWRSMRRIGWLTKINRDGTMEQPDWVDENYRVTVDPVYDKSINKEEKKENLLYGEHIDWTWATEWRQVIKISPNGRHTFWTDAYRDWEPIYIDGGPVKFQFKGKNNPFDSLPPVEGCLYSYINTEPHSFIDRIKPFQIIYNIAMNKVPKKFLKDYGMKVAIDRRSFSTNNPSAESADIDPALAYEDKLRDSDILDYHMTRESLDGLGQPALPTVLQLSTAQEAQFYLQIGDSIKWMAGESIGITRQRVGGQKASETAFSVQQGIQYSETQTEKYFEQHTNLMERFRQRMLDAAQYYTTFHETSRDIYMNDMEENVFLEIEGTDNLLPHYNINIQSRANVRAALQTIGNFLQNENTLPIKPSAKLEALVESSVPKILNLVKVSELEQEQQLQQQQQMEYQQAQEKIRAEQAMQEQELANTNEQKALDREKDIEIATIRAKGGIQTDVNLNKIPDAQENLEPYLRQQEISNSMTQKQDEIASKRQIETDKRLIERQKIAAELEKTKIQAESNEKIAEKNKNRYDKKS